jgi:signal transduction histidine kinase
MRDRGRGLDKKELKKVLEKFYRVKPEGENVRGTGLGLHIVQTIIRGYGGSVKMESDGPGQGCTVTLTMPLA